MILSLTEKIFNNDLPRNEEKKYPFIDFVRFWSMVSIIYIHSNLTPNFSPIKNQEWLFWIYSPIKFGTLCFFLISGYLLGDNVHFDYPLDYLQKRFKSTFLPYIIALFLFCLSFFSKYFYPGFKWNHETSFIILLLNDFKGILCGTSFWFIWNYFICLSIILLLRKHLFKPITPIIFFFISIAYGLNVYWKIIPEGHTTAFPAYLSYLWAGIYLRENPKIFKTLQEISLPILLIMATVLIPLKHMEFNMIENVHSGDPINTLILSNQLYSVIIFFILINLSRLGIPQFFNPRNETYGLYLYHWFFVLALSRFIRIFSPQKFWLNLSPLSNFLILNLIFLTIYFLTTYLVKWLNKNHLFYLTGARDSMKLKEQLIY